MHTERMNKNSLSMERFADRKPGDAADQHLVDSLGACCMDGNLDGVNELFADEQEGADYIRLIDYACNNGGTPLVLACYGGHLELVQTLLEQGADKNGPCLQGTYPLYTAAQQGHLELVQYLVEQGANPMEVNKPDDEDVIALHIACHRGHAEVVQYLLDLDPSIVDIQKLGGATPFFLACQEGHKGIAEYLLENGADPNHRRGDGRSSLFLASQKGHVEIVKWLMLELEVPVEAEGEESLTCLHAAAMFGEAETVKAICEAYAERWDYDKRKIFVNAETVDGYTSLELRDAHSKDSTVDSGVYQALLDFYAEDREAAKDVSKTLPENYEAKVYDPDGKGAEAATEGQDKDKEKPAGDNADVDVEAGEGGEEAAEEGEAEAEGGGEEAAEEGEAEAEAEVEGGGEEAAEEGEAEAEAEVEGGEEE